MSGSNAKRVKCVTKCLEKKTVSKATSNRWIAHVKAYRDVKQQELGPTVKYTYKDAMQESRCTYNPNVKR